MLVAQSGVELIVTERQREVSEARYVCLVELGAGGRHIVLVVDIEAHTLCMGVFRAEGERTLPYRVCHDELPGPQVAALSAVARHVAVA